MFTITHAKLSEAAAQRALAEWREADARASRDLVSRVPSARRCAYRQWCPALAARCECWGCLRGRGLVPW